MKHFEQTLVTYAASQTTFAISIRNTSNIPLKHMKYFKTYIYNIWEGRSGPVRLISVLRHQTTGTPRTHGCLGSTGNPPEARGAPDGAGASDASSHVGLREQGARGAGGRLRWTGARSKKDRVGVHAEDGCGDKCGVSGRAVAQRREACDRLDIFKRKT
jgi:hypothetical protein